MSDDEESTMVPFVKRKKLRAFAESTSTPMATLVFRGFMGLSAIVGLATVGIFGLGLKTRAEQIIADSPSMQTLVKKADDTEKRAWKLAADLKDTQTLSREKDTELDANLTRISTALSQVSMQQVKTADQQADTARQIAVLVNHVGDMDKTMDRHERALEKKPE